MLRTLSLKCIKIAPTTGAYDSDTVHTGTFFTALVSVNEQWGGTHTDSGGMNTDQLRQH